METCNCVGKLNKLPNDNYYQEYECDCGIFFIQVNKLDNYISYIRNSEHYFKICLDDKCLLGCEVSLQIKFNFINDISYIRGCLNKIYKNIIFL